MSLFLIHIKIIFHHLFYWNLNTGKCYTSLFSHSPTTEKEHFHDDYVSLPWPNSKQWRAQPWLPGRSVWCKRWQWRWWESYQSLSLLPSGYLWYMRTQNVDKYNKSCLSLMYWLDQSNTWILKHTFLTTSKIIKSLASFLFSCIYQNAKLKDALHFQIT